MNDTSRNNQPSSGPIYGFIGVALFVIGWLSLANANENSAFGAIGGLFLACGLYVTVSGAVARGIQLARR